MHLGERCDEIVRLIDETLVSADAECPGDDGGGGGDGHPSGAALVGRGARPLEVVRRARRHTRGSRSAGGRPAGAA
jgi:hypothetical protein